MTWSQTWSGNFLEKTTTEMWKRNLDDERIIALDDMPGWDKVSAIGSKVTKNAFRQLSNKVAIVLQGNNLSVTVPQSGHANIALFDILGHQIVSLAQGNLPAGTLQFDLNGIANGHYIVRAKIGSVSNAQKISIK